jgi:hypothetical protein
MHELGNTIRKHIPTNGKFAKALTIIYVIWLLVLIIAIVNTYGPTNPHRASANIDWVVTGFSILSLVIPAFISTLQDNAYMVQLYGPRSKKYQTYLQRLDERQLHIRREVFEKSYVIFATLVFLSVFVGSSWFDNLSENGTFAFGYSIFIFVVSLPSLVAIWDQKVNIHNID